MNNYFYPQIPLMPAQVQYVEKNQDPLSQTTIQSNNPTMLMPFANVTTPTHKINEPFYGNINFYDSVTGKPISTVSSLTTPKMNYILQNPLGLDVVITGDKDIVEKINQFLIEDANKKQEKKEPEYLPIGGNLKQNGGGEIYYDIDSTPPLKRGGFFFDNLNNPYSLNKSFGYSTPIITSSTYGSWQLVSGLLVHPSSHIRYNGSGAIFFEKINNEPYITLVKNNDDEYQDFGDNIDINDVQMGILENTLENNVKNKIFDYSNAVFSLVRNTIQKTAGNDEQKLYVEAVDKNYCTYRAYFIHLDENETYKYDFQQIFSDNKNSLKKNNLIGKRTKEMKKIMRFNLNMLISLLSGKLTDENFKLVFQDKKGVNYTICNRTKNILLHIIQNNANKTFIRNIFNASTVIKLKKNNLEGVTTLEIM